MKNTKKLVYECAECRGAARVLHEIIFGNGNRQICIEYNIQAPLCPLCHGAAHDKWTPHGNSPLYRFRKADMKTRKIVLDTQAIARHLCETYLHVDYWSILSGVKSKMNRQNLIMVREDCERIIKNSIICRD
jgi:hypothetical protein